MLRLLRKLVGSANDRIVRKFSRDINKINELEPEIQALSDKELQAKTARFKEKIASGARLDSIMHEAFAVVREASRRVLQMRHFDVQLIGGIVLHKGMITEMRTGEGKTLVATLPAYLNALEGRGLHVVTVNDYLAMRDCEWMKKIYEFLGLSCAYIVSGMEDNARKAAYAADITYATNNELGFDYLRDNMKYSADQKVQRELNYAIIDEVDSILIDEARTPLIISGPVEDNVDLYSTIDNVVSKLSAGDYEKDEKLKTVNLTDEGINKVEKALLKMKLIEPESSLYDFANLTLLHHTNQSLKAHQIFKKDVDYLVRDGRVMIIDEFTGRVMEGRRYSDGLHQALEAREGVKVQNENQTLASVTFQNYFRNYGKLCGMTGTAVTESEELKDIYNLDVIVVPTHKTIARVDHDDEIYGTTNDKYKAIINLIKESHSKGQPILVGTASIEKSEEISKILSAEKIKHNVLNAKHHEREASIIAQAGRLGAITIATNMAGRGTDIKLGGNSEMLIAELKKNENISSDELKEKTKSIEGKVKLEEKKVLDAGGLFVMGTERHESRRIDNQLRGRSGRQGDPGETKFFLSLEDDLMRIFASDRIAGMLRTLGLKDGEAIHHPMISRSLEKAQRKVESQNYEIRKNLLRFDDVMNDQRKVIYNQRREILEKEDVSDSFMRMQEELLRGLVLQFIDPRSLRENWQLQELEKEILRIFGVKYDTKKNIGESDVTEEDVLKTLGETLQKNYDDKVAKYSQKIFHSAQKYVLLTTLDNVWKDHLHHLDHLRQGISLRAYGQKDPLNEYKKEAFGLFEKMMYSLKELFVQRVCYLNINVGAQDADSLSIEKKKMQEMHQSREDPGFTKYNSGKAIDAQLQPIKAYVPEDQRDPNDPSTWGKVSRNSLCPCGSGKKYKHCHGMAS